MNKMDAYLILRAWYTVLIVTTTVVVTAIVVSRLIGGVL